jgi:homoserine kinase type II
VFSSAEHLVDDERLRHGMGAVPPAAAARVADELLRRFGLGSPLQLEVAPGGLLNQNLFATTARGAYFLKGYRYPEPPPVAREHRVIAYVRERGVPALSPLPGPAGETFLKVGGRFWAVYPRVDARQPEPAEMTPPLARELGLTLGRIHVALADFPAVEALSYPVKVTWDSARAAGEMAEYEAMIARRPALDPFDQHTLSSFGYRRTLLASGVPDSAAFAQLPSQLLHGDFHERNLFVTADGRVEHVIDWELTGRGPRAWEIIRALDVALGLRRDMEAGGDLLRAFVAGYASAAPLTQSECAAMPDLYWAARVHSLWVYEEHYRKGSARTDRLAMEDLETLHWLAGNRQHIGVALRDALESAPGQQLAL